MKTNLWHVHYDWRFKSSSLSQDDQFPSQESDDYIATETPDLDSVRNELIASLPNNAELLQVRSATWMGRLLNRAVEADCCYAKVPTMTIEQMNQMLNQRAELLTTEQMEERIRQQWIAKTI